MTFAAPLWLLGLGVLAVPLVLHLLARGRGRRVAVGSVQLLTAGAARRPRRARLQRPLLLLVRCLLLATLVLALAAPRWTLPPRAEPVRAWVLVAPEVASVMAADSAHGLRDSPELPPAARTALATGGELRLLAPGIPILTAARSEATRKPATSDVRGGVWSLLREADATAPAGAPFVVIGRGRLADLAGERPSLARAVQWEPRVEPRASPWLLADRRSSTAALPRVRVALHADAQRARDAARVDAALAAAAESTAEIVRAGAEDAPQLAFWLGDEEPPATLRTAIADGATLVRDGAPGAPCDTTATVLAAMPPVGWRRCPPDIVSVRATGGSAPPRTLNAVWRGAGGQPLLTVEPLGRRRGRILRLAGRFDAATSDLVDTPAFVHWLRALLVDAAPPVPSSAQSVDRRPDGGQGAPQRASGRVAAARSQPSPVPEATLWWLLPVLLVVERWLGARP